MHIGGAGNSLAGSALFFTMIIRKTYEVQQVAETPTTSDLEAIRKYALKDVTAEDVFLGKMALANTKVDRSHERIPLPYLKRFAETLAGKPVMTGHDLGSLPVGRFYEADVVGRADGEHEIIARYYLPADSPLTKSVELGIASGVSIQGRADSRTCSICTKSYDRCAHDAGKEYDGKQCVAEWGGDVERYESVEGSFVATPCQFGTQALACSLPAGYVAKSAAPGGAQILEYDAADPAPQGDAMELKEALEKIALLEGELATLKKTHEENEPLVKAGEQYRVEILKEIATKTAAVYDDEAAQTMVKTLENGSIDSLLTWKDSAQKRFDQKFPPAPIGQSRDVTKDETPRPFDPVAANPWRRSA